jgi:2,4-didehydro-3-deoxy-L-rhamnonate hydrolase
MQLANVDGRAAVVWGSDPAAASVHDLGTDAIDAIERLDEVRSIAASLEVPPPSDLRARLGPPVPRPRQVFAIGLNYGAHAAETGREPPAIPATFTKFPSALTGPFATVALPSAHVDWEVELVVVVGREAHGVAEADGWAHVAGFTVGQDLSERRVQQAAGAQFSLGKSYAGFAPTGPWMVTLDALADPADLALGCALDGEVLQNSRTSDLIFDVPRLVAELSAVVTLWPGDLIFTGTPAGVGAARTPPRFLQPGQTLVSTIEGIGIIETTFT